MNLPHAHPPHVLASVIEAHAKKTASATAAELGMTLASVRGIWARARAAGKLGTKRLAAPSDRHDHDAAALAALKAIGANGLSKEALGLALNDRSEHAVASFKKRLAGKGIHLDAHLAVRADRVDVYHYTLREARQISTPPASRGALCTELGITPITREVDGFLGLGATPGARVSVPFVSFLDTPRARDGRGDG